MAIRQYCASERGDIVKEPLLLLSLLSNVKINVGLSENASRTRYTMKIELKLKKWVLEKKVFSCLLKDGSELLAEVTMGGRLFHTHAAATPNARSPMVHCLKSDPVEHTAADRAWSITDTVSVLCTLEDHAVLQSLRNTNIAPPWQFRLWGLLCVHKCTYLLTYLLKYLITYLLKLNSQKSDSDISPKFYRGQSATLGLYFRSESPFGHLGFETIKNFLRRPNCATQLQWHHVGQKFFCIIIRLSVTAEELPTNIDWKYAFVLQQGQFVPKVYVEGVVLHQISFLSEI